MSLVPARIVRIVGVTTIGVLTATAPSIGNAHMPWLATDDDGGVVLWFGESPDDRTYHLPESVASIRLNQIDSDRSRELGTRAVDTDSLVGLRSVDRIEASGEVTGSVTYGVYHGTKLTYHVEHLPSRDPASWPTHPRRDAAMQTVIRPAADGGIQVSVLHHGEPVTDTEVKLYCEEGHQEAARSTDDQGIVAFSDAEVEGGLNAILVGVTMDGNGGSLDGQAFGSTTDYLTATFFKGPAEPTPAMQKAATPQVDPDSGASITPSGLPDLPEELTSFGAALAGQTLYVYGGHTGSAHSYSTDEQSDRFWSLDLAAGADAVWTQRPGGPSLQGLALVAHGDRVIRIGGFTAVNPADQEHDLRSQTGVAVYDPKTQAWTDLTPLPEARSSLDAAVLDDTVYVFGGWKLDGKSDQGHWHQTAWSLDLNDPAAAWKPLATPPFQRRAVSVAAHAGKLYVIGGMQSEGEPTTRVDVYDPRSDAWSLGPAVPGRGMSGFGSTSFASEGNLYVSTMDGFVHRLSGDQGSWQTIARSDPARFFHRLVPIAPSRLLLIGGANMEIGKFVQIDTVHTGHRH